MILRGYKLLSFTSNTEFTVTEKKNQLMKKINIAMSLLFDELHDHSEKIKPIV